MPAAVGSQRSPAKPPGGRTTARTIARPTSVRLFRGVRSEHRETLSMRARPRISLSASNRWFYATRHGQQGVSTVGPEILSRWYTLACHTLNGPSLHGRGGPASTPASSAPATRSTTPPECPPLRIRSANSGMTRTRTARCLHTGARRPVLGRVRAVHRCNGAFR